MANAQDDLIKAASNLAQSDDCDTLIYIGGVNLISARQLINTVGSRIRRKNLFVIIGTNGGDARAAYKISRCLQHAYEQGSITVGVFGECKSAGTLMALTGNAIVMSQHAELGPLDVQLKKDDQLFVLSSGLTTTQALASLKKEAMTHFEHFLLELHAGMGFEISTRLATSMSIRMTTGLLGPIYQQIDPIRIGETQRAMDVAKAYGDRLNTRSNLKPGALNKLIEGYPSHDFAIDFDEAGTLFVNIDVPNALQSAIGKQLESSLLNFKAISSESAIVVYLNPEPKTSDPKKKKESHETIDATDGGGAEASGGDNASGTEGGGGETAGPSGDASKEAVVKVTGTFATAANGKSRH